MSTQKIKLQANGQNSIDLLMAMGCTFKEAFNELQKI